MDWARLVLDYIDTLAWPLAVVGLVVFFLLRFRQSIDGLIRRIQKASGLGVQIEAAISQEPIDLEAGGEALGSEAVQQLTERHADTISEIPQPTEALDLPDRTADVSGLPEPAAVAGRKLLQAYNNLYVFYQFERIYRLIYGTQIRADAVPG